MIYSQVGVAATQASSLDLPVRVLVVDDEGGMRRSLARVLKAKGYQVETAESGEQALLLAAAFQPQCVLIDVRMPGIGGVEASCQLKQKLPDAMLIFMSAFFADGVVDEVQALGPVKLLPKPLDIERLLVLIEEAL